MSQPFYIAFDEAHKPRGRISGNYSQLKAHLESLGFVCQSFMEFPITRQNLSPYDILVIPCPDNSKFSADEIETIYDWVKNSGGGLVMLSHAGGDKGRRSNLTELAEKFGMSFENDQVLDKKHNFGIENLPEISEFNPPHPITEDISSLCFRAGCSLTTFGMNALPIVTSNEESEPFSSPLVVAAKIEEGKVVASGSYEIFRDKIAGGFSQDQHAQFATNLFNWIKSEYREKIKSGEIKPKLPFNPPGSVNAQNIANNISKGGSGIGVAPNIAPDANKSFTSFNILSQIKISDKSDLAGLLYALLNEVDVLKQQVQTIIETVVTSEEQIMGMNAEQTVPLEPQTQSGTEHQYSPQVDSFEQPIQVQPTDSLTENKGFLGISPKDDKPLSPLPPRPSSLLGKQQPSYQESTSQQSEYRPPPEMHAPTGNFNNYEQSNNTTESIESTSDSDSDFNASAVLTPDNTEMSLEELRSELETLESKLRSIEDLKAMVERKFNSKSFTKSKYDKQMQMLDNDKKKTTFRIDEIENMIKKMK